MGFRGKGMLEVHDAVPLARGNHRTLHCLGFRVTHVVALS